MSLPVKGEWVWHFSNSRDFRRNAPGWHIFSFIVGKMRHDLEPGVMVRQRDVHGVVIQFCYWWPIEKL